MTGWADVIQIRNMNGDNVGRALQNYFVTQIGVSASAP
jgi:hypothetical protein